ncbi:MAG: hypothetical protein IKE60_34675 [Reyranella sp.]|uniref:hypothetical protein n=1 Tax=Reyranella sp. TaxID=1929291 RepID=UPI0025F54803|nr:hypothetical protein [Reyranella sp.]MBR2819867.1 hypothetical protein [Reyranella sp.]
MAKQDPLFEELANLYKQRKSIGGDELERRLIDAQEEIERRWETGEWKITPDEAKVRTCDREGCNHSRYPVPNARGCIFHSRGHDSLAANYQRARARER